MGDQTWLEGWQEGQDGESCGTPIAPHNGSNSATWSYDATAKTITVVGSGAFLGLAKVHNTGEDGKPANTPSRINMTYLRWWLYGPNN